MNGKSSLLRSALFAAMAFAVTGAASLPASTALAASKIKVVVNNTAITSGDIARRGAFLRLQRQGGNNAKLAQEQLIDEVLKRSEVVRVKMSVSTSEVDASYARFAGNNKMSTKQLDQVLNQAGVGSDHFKQFIAVQMSWPRVVNARYGSSGKLSTQDLVTRMLEGGGKKPSTTEYFLQQVIFVVPESKRGIVGKRQQEANASRSKFPGCDTSKVFAATMRDVSIRNLGRLMQQELPEDWKPFIEKASENGTTATRVTPRGVEYLAICKKREVSDDLAAEIVFRAEDLGKKDQGGEDPNSKKYLDELRGKAQISFR